MTIPLYHLIGGSLKRKGRPDLANYSAIDAATPAGAQPQGGSGFTLVFSDEFAGSSVDRAKWEVAFPDTSFWNATTPGGHLTNSDEPQAYDPSGLTVAASVLTMTMRDESTVPGLPYTSGMISSYPSFNPLYGFFEARMRLDQTSGSWPAFWMFPTNQTWPPEIDIMEFWGGAGASPARATYHPAAGGYSFHDQPVDSVENWHTYGCLWEAGRVRFYVDGAMHFERVNADVSNTPMFLILNMAGDKLNPPSAASLPITAEVDYVRAWSA